MKNLYSKLSWIAVPLLAVAALAPAGHAQTLSAVTISSSPDGPWFYVDGTVYFHAMSAFWPVGSLHTLTQPYGTSYVYNNAFPNQTIQYQFQGWQWTGGSSSQSTLQVIADPSITRYTANYTEQYLVGIQMSCGSGPCTAVPGGVIVNGAALNFGAANTLASWAAAGASQALQAYSNPGWLFAGWQVGSNPVVTSAIDTIAVNAPMTITALFIPSKTITFTTNPPNMFFYADGELITTPYNMQWGLGTAHTLTVTALQNDSANKLWVFGSWSDGGAASHTYTVGAGSNPETITETFAPAASSLLYTSPPFLSLVVDGQVLPPPYSFLWGVGSTHTVAAPASQTDAQGNTWKFKSWDDTVTTPARTITVPVGADVNGFRLEALYTAQAQLTVGSSPAGLTVTVDGSACATPCSVLRSMGTQVHVSAPASVSAGSGSREDFLGWSTGGATLAPGDWIATLTAPSTTISATYHLMNSLTANANPPGGASWTILPASPDGFYDSQTLVTLAVSAQPGYRFSNWSGDLSGSVPNGSLSMSVPHQVLAQFASVPYVAPSGVSNAAGTLPQPGVAPGSVASIYGANLAAATAVGPVSPMVQTLAGVTARMGNNLLPLYFASPAQINLQIPPDLAPGAQTITVSSLGMPDVNTNFTIVRNAPGLFPVVLDGQTYALVLHQDGTLVTPESPAQRSEVLTLYGTGLGPTNPARPEGIGVPATPPYLMQDPVTVQVGSSIFTPQSAFAAPGQVGLDLVQFQLDSSAPSGNAVPLYLTVNGVSSNTLALAIQ